jgi:glycosyltransferase involved in cell wall biosynthesis
VLGVLTENSTPNSENSIEMRVAWLFEYPTLHGGEHSLLATLPYLRSAGVEAVALAPAAGPLAERLRRENVESAPFETLDGAGRKDPPAELREQLAERLVEIKPDLLHANSLAMGRLSGPVAADLRLPGLSHLRDIIKLSAAAVADLNRHVRLLAVSRATRDFHAAQGLAAEKLHVLYNGVDLQEFHPRAPSGRLRARLGLPADALLVGAIGQLVMRKGHDVLARAAASLAERLPRAHWVLAGARYSQKAEAVEYEAALRRTFAAAGLGERVHFLGTIDAIADLLPELAMLVHPSRQEPLGRVLLEAAASGVACIATDVGGTREIFPPAGSAARLVPAGDAEALAAAIAELAANPQERVRLGQAARRRAEACFDIRQAAAGLVRHYRDARGSGFPA